MRECGIGLNGESERMKYANNVKPGDIIVSKIGSAVLLRETRAKWFYLFRDRVNSISKSEFWRMVDIGEMDISYVETKKYRRKQKHYRVFDMRQHFGQKELLLENLKNFLSLLDPDVFLVFAPGWREHDNDQAGCFSGCINYLKDSGYHCSIEKSKGDFMYVKIKKDNKELDF